jgi:hypothetical protein
MRSSVCLLATRQDQPVAFSSSALAALWTALGYRAISTTTHPAIIRSRLASVLW